MRKTISFLMLAFFATAIYSQASGIVENQLYVKKNPSTSEATAENFIINLQGTMLTDFNVLDWALTEFPVESDIESIIEVIENSGYFSIVVNRIIPELTSTIPSDSYFDYQWYLYNDGSIQGSIQDADVDADRAWDNNTGNQNILIGILDSGLPMNDYHGGNVYDYLNHSDLDNPDKIILGWFDVVLNQNTGFGRFKDAIGHGTHVAGIVSAETNNNYGIAGLGYNTGIYIAQIYNWDQYSPFPRAILWTAYLQGAFLDVINNAKVINVSWGSIYYDFGVYLEDVIKEAYDNDVLIVCSAGNDYADNVRWPARFAYQGNLSGNYPQFENGYPNVISVGATTVSDEKSYYSNYGQYLCVAAPGGSNSTNGGLGVGDPKNILSTYPEYLHNMPNNPFSLPPGNSPGFVYMAGTSMATPLVVSIGALLFNINPNYSAGYVREIIEHSAEKVGPYTYNSNGRCNELGYGRVNAFYAVSPPSAPQDLSLSNQNNHPCLNWTANTEPDFEICKIYRKIVINDRYETVIEDWNKIAETTTNSYTDQTFGIMTGGAFKAYYKIKAIDYANYQSPYSSIVNTEGIMQMKPTTEVEKVPEIFALHSNYPNPFNPTTKIKFDLPEDSFTRLSVYDIKGSVVQTLINKQLNAGQHQVSFSAENLPSGVYIYQLSAGSYTAIKRMVLLK